jgi:hypothetical protein
MYLFDRNNGIRPSSEFPSVFATCIEVHPRPKFVLLNSRLGPISLRGTEPILIHTCLQDTRDLFGTIEGKTFQRITNLYIKCDSTYFSVVQLDTYNFLMSGAPYFYPTSTLISRKPLNAIEIRSLLKATFNAIPTSILKPEQIHEEDEEEEEDNEDLQIHNPVQITLKPHTLRAIILQAVGTDCPISFEPIVEVSAAVTTCQHVFKRDAIERWLLANTTCPVCREECELC